MNTQSSAMREFPPVSEQHAAPSISAARLMGWSVKRELWENRYVYIVPLAVAAVALFAFLIATIGRAMSTSDMVQRRAILEEPYTFVTSLIMAAAFIVGLIYCLEAMHGERRDRSILFWKSLPVSDLITVLSKLSIPLVILPLFSFAIVVVAQITMLLLSTIVLVGNGISAGPLWTRLFQMLLGLLYHLATVHMLWYAPIYAWLLLVSAWARRAVFLWAALPVAAVGIIEKLAFNTSHFVDFLKYRITGPEIFDVPDTGPMAHFSLGRFLLTPGLWAGLIFAAASVFAAARLRRYQGPV